MDKRSASTLPFTRLFFVPGLSVLKHGLSLNLMAVNLTERSQIAFRKVKEGSAHHQLTTYSDCSSLGGGASPRFCSKRCFLCASRSCRARIM